MPRPIDKTGMAGVGATSPSSPVSAKDRNPHPSRPFAAVVAKGSFGSRWAEGVPPRLPVNLYNQESHVLSPQCVPCRNLGDAVSNQPGSQ